MKQVDIIKQVAEQTGLSQRKAGETVKAVLETIKAGLKSEGEVTFLGFGKFSVALRGERRGRNPQTGEPMVLPATKAVRFSPGATLKKEVNE